MDPRVFCWESGSKSRTRHGSDAGAVTQEHATVLSQPSWHNPAALLGYAGASQSVKVALRSFQHLGSELVHAVLPSDVTKRLGEVLDGSVATEDDFLVSKKVSVINDFVSHDWSTGRWPKFFALAIHYNVAMATVAMYIFAFSAAALTATGYLPLFTISPAFQVSGKLCFHSLFAGHATFLVFLCFGNELRQLLRVKQRSVFLDKLCIPQGNEEHMKEAIRRLPTCLECSDFLVVLYSAQYTRTLWTVYEIASFFLLHRDSNRITMFPVVKVQGLIFFAGVLIFETLSFSIGSIIPESGVHKVIYPVVECLRMLLILSMSFCALRAWEEDTQGMRKDIGEFSVRSCVCSVDKERALVEANVRTLVRSLNKVPSNASDDAALEAFDDLVRQELPPAFQTSLRRSLLDYTYVVAITVGLFTLQLDVAASRIASGAPWPLAFTAFLEGACLNFGVCPVWNWLMAQVLHSKLHRHVTAEDQEKQDQDKQDQTNQEYLTVKKSVLFALPLALIFYLPVLMGKVLAETFFMPAFACFLLGGYTCFVTGIAVWLYRPSRSKRRSAVMKLFKRPSRDVDEESLPLATDEVLLDA